MKIRYEAKAKYKFGDLIPGAVLSLGGEWFIKTDCDTAVNIANGREVGLDDSCLVGVPDNVELVIVGG